VITAQASSVSLKKGLSVAFNAGSVTGLLKKEMVKKKKK
jgi:Na+/H+-translocating membrane pyrophosphatase